MRDGPETSPPQSITTSRVRFDWRVAVLFLVLTLLMAYPVPFRPASGMMGDDPDGHLFVWTLAWDVHALTTRPLAVFDANIFHPYGNTLAYSENLIGSAVLAAPVLWLTGNPLTAMNLVSVLSCVLCGIGAYVLGRRLKLTESAAILAGIVFAFAPPRFFRMPQMHVNAVQWIPFCLAFLHAYFENGRRRDLRLAVAFFTLQTLASGHGAAFLVVAVAALLLYKLALGEPLAPWRRVRDLGLPGILLLVPAMLIYVPYREVQAEMGLVRTLEGQWFPVAESFLASPSVLHTWLHSFLRDPHVNTTASAFLFPGYTPLVLTVIALWHVPPMLGTLRGAVSRWLARRRERKTDRSFYALLVLVCLLLSVGPPLSIWPLVYWLPGLNFIRGPSRFMVLAMLGFAILAGAGFDRISSRLAGTRRTLAAVVVAALLLGESWGPLQFDPFRLQLPGVDRWLATRPGPFAIAEVPVGGTERYQTIYMLHSTAHWQKTIHGYSGFRPPAHDLLYRQLQHFPDDTSLDALAAFGVNYVVVHSELYPPEEWLTVDERLRQFSHRLSLEHVNGPGRVYSLRPQTGSVAR